MKQATQSGRWMFPLVAVALVAATAALGWSVGQFRNSREPAPSSVASKRGALLYQTTCANCHGAEGWGDGVSSATLTPPPRDFAARPWRFEPTKASIRRVILEGIPGTSMPASQGSLVETDLDLLVEHVYGLAASNGRSPVPYGPTPDELRLKAAGFINLRGITPPPLSVSDASGRTTTLADLRGRLVIVHFWGTSCVHCLQEMPALCKLEADHASRGLTILHVCAEGEAPKEAQEILDKHVTGARALTDAKGLGLARFEVQGLPTVWLIAPDGKAIGRASGAVDWHSPGFGQLIEFYLGQRER